MPAKLNFFRRLQEGQRIDHTSAIVLARVRTQTAGQKIRRHQLSLQLPNITGQSVINYNYGDNLQAYGFCYAAKNDRGLKGGTFNGTNSSTSRGSSFYDAGRQTSLYGKSATVQPMSIRLMPCIKI